MRAADRIVLAWCDPGVVDGAFAIDIARLYAERRDRIAAPMRVSGGLIPRQRNEAAALFLTTNAQWLMMVDSDQRISIEAFDLLVDAVHDELRPAVSGLVFAAYPGDLYPTPVPTIYRTAEDGLNAPITDYPTDSLIEVDGAGGGFFIVHRRVLEAIRDSAPDDARDWSWFRSGPLHNRWLSEDHFFWRQVRHHGFPIHAHTGAILPHRKSYWLDDRHHKEIHHAQDHTR